MALHVNGPGGGRRPEKPEETGKVQNDKTDNKGKTQDKKAEEEKKLLPEKSAEEAFFEGVVDMGHKIGDPVMKASVKQVVEHPVETAETVYEVAKFATSQPGFWDRVGKTFKNAWTLLTTGKINIKDLV